MTLDVLVDEQDMPLDEPAAQHVQSPEQADVERPDVFPKVPAGQGVGEKAPRGQKCAIGHSIAGVPPRQK